MMSSRLIRVSDAKGGHESPASRRGFYRWIDGAYTWMLSFAMRHRLAVALVSLAVVLSSVPLYRAVKQEFIPTNVDEAEFEIGVNGPEGTNLAVMNETMTAIRERHSRHARCHDDLVVRGWWIPRRCEPGRCLHSHRAA
jgi:HAE1 family hydrophobic/amphiphilic exporter-1